MVQRVSHASVHIDNGCHSLIDKGILVLVGIHREDTVKDIKYLTKKLLNLRIFSDEHGKMNRSALDLGCEILVVSQFTLYAQTKEGNRPSFSESMQPTLAKELYLDFVKELQETYLPNKISCGVFGADMKVTLCNDGPVTILLESK